MTAGRGALAARAAALAIAACLVALVWAGLVRPYASAIGDLAAALSARETIVARYRALAAQEPPAPREPSEPTEGDVAGLLLPKASEAQAAALLQERLKGYAAEARVELDGVQVLPRTDTAGVVKVAVRLRGRADMPALNRFLHTLETTRPMLVVDGLRVQGRGGRDAARNDVDIQLDVAAFTGAGET